MGWSPAAWAPEGCDVIQADDPVAAGPPLVWEPCPSGAPGCERVKFSWSNDLAAANMTDPSVYSGSRGYIVGGYVVIDTEFRALIWDHAGNPLAVWRIAESLNAPCDMLRPFVEPDGFWFGAQGLETGVAYFYQRYADLGQTPQISSAVALSQDQGANAELLGLESVGAGVVSVTDRTTNETHILQAPAGGGVQVPHPAGAIATIRYQMVDGITHGWIWRRSTASFLELIPAGPETVLDFRSDGQTMAWVKTAFLPGEKPPGFLWKSPHAEDPGDLAPQLVRAVPAGVEANTAIGDGHFAIVTWLPPEDPGTVHIYRLADGRHWSFDPEPEFINQFAISHVDADTIWYSSIEGVYRQALSALGPGD